MMNSMWIECLKLVGGLIILVGCGDLLVKGAVNFARHFKISSLVIGLTIVAFGTSAPELVVSLIAAIKGAPEIALGNVIGSNISNIGLVLGVTALILPLPVVRSSMHRSWPIMMLSVFLFIVTFFDGTISRVEGFILVFGLILFILSSFRDGRKSSENEIFEKPEVSIPKASLYVLLASGGLALGSNLLVSGAENIAISLGVSERIIAITLVAFGTSVPELATSVMAALRKETDISVGNIIGSNIFNVFAVIGMTCIVKPIQSIGDEQLWTLFSFDMLVMLIVSLLLFILIVGFKRLTKKELFQGKTYCLTRPAGFILLGSYIAYIILIL